MYTLNNVNYMLINMRSGTATVVLAFVLWGITPLFYQYLSGGDLTQIIIYRVVWSMPLLLLARLLLRHRTPIRTLWQDRRSFFCCMLAGLLMIVSWSSFIYALTHHQVLDASLGYFINPLIVIALGCLFLKEKLSAFQVAAVALGACGLTFQIISLRHLPVLPLMMGVSFALYGLVRKFIRYDALTSITLETLWAMPVALILFFATGSGSGFAANTPHLLYILTAPVTVIPLILFAIALNKTSLVVTGLAQYIEPSLQFIIAILIFREQIDYPELVCFSAVWLGLLLCVSESFVAHRRLHSHAS